MKRIRIGLVLALSLAGFSAAQAQTRPPAQKTGPITIYGTGSTGDASKFTVRPPGAVVDTPLDAMFNTIPKFVGNKVVITNGPELFTLNNGVYSPVGGKGSTKTVYVATDGSDDADGLSSLAPKATLQAAVDAAAPNGRVNVGAGSFVLTNTLFVRPGVKLSCNSGTSIVRGNNTPFSSLIDFSTFVANGASAEGCTIADNIEANAPNSNWFTVNIGDASDVRFTSNRVINSLGYAVYVRNGLRPTIANNYIYQTHVAAISIIPQFGGGQVAGTITDNLMYGPFGLHAMIINNADNTVISRNRILSPAPILSTINVSGATVTQVGGADFSSLRAGQFITFGTGYEFLIDAKNSNTSLTLNTPAGTPASNIPAVSGDGDLMSLANSQHTIVSDNYVYGGGAGGIVASNFIAGSGNQEDYAFNSIVNNTVTYSAASCISLQATTTSPATAVYDNSISGNVVHRCGIGNTAGLAANRTGISVFDFTGAIGAARTTIVGNVSRDDLSNTLYGITLSGVYAGQVQAGNNNMRGSINFGIGGGIKGVQLSGWGSGAYASDFLSFGDSYGFTVVSGTSPGQYPTATVATAATATSFPPQHTCKQTGGTGPAALITGEQNSQDYSQTLVYNGTPTGGATYIITCR